MQMVRWIFEKMLFFEFYGYEKNSREIDVSRMYLMIWVISAQFNSSVFGAWLR